jgi:carboxypeptidase PM20D1
MRRAVLTIAALLGAVVVGGVGLALVRATTMTSIQPQVSPVDEPVDEAHVAELLGQSLRFRTVSRHDHTQADPAPFEALNAWLPEAWPRLHANPQVQVEAFGLSRLYKWQGTDPSLPPILLMAHTDVVPVEDGSSWSRDPWSGAVADGHVWGRGAIDMKAAMVGFMEAADGLGAEGFQPKRTVYLALGHDEEVGGHHGHEQVAEALAQRGVRFSWVLDEGLVITDGIVPGLAAPAALIGASEKGYLTVELIAQGLGGHSSMPPPQSAAGIVAGAAARLEATPFPADVDGPVAEMFAWLAPEMGFVERLAFANLWLLGPVVQGKLEAKNNTNATLRTTIAVTQLEGSVQENVLPQEARAVVNLRLHPRDSIESALQHVVAAVDDPRVEVRPVEDSIHSEPSPVSSTQSEGWQIITRSIREVNPEVVVAPGLMIGGTDSRWYVPLADDVYRFHPAWLGPEDTNRIHGTDERISTENLADYVRFYRRVLQAL